MELTSTNVRNVLLDCMFEDNEDITNHKIGSGVVLNIGFNPERLEKHSADIDDFLSQLPKDFQKEPGGGMSFLNACVREDGVNWGEHRSVDELLCLGLASEKISFLMPRELWGVLPGGMPYFVIN